MRWLDGITSSVDKNLSKLRKKVKDTEAWHAAIHGGGRAGHNLATEQVKGAWHTKDKREVFFPSF